jgi:inhibitor of KinA
MTVEALGESVLILRELPIPAYRAAARIRAAVPRLEEVVAAFDTVGIYFKDDPPVDAVLESALALACEEETLRRHVVPVCYELGEDLEEAATRLHLETADVVRAHAGGTYTCFAIGFCPGFPYLGRLPEGLQGLPRRPSPRVRVEPGSVAITGDQTGVYPLPRPGGWWLIGKTPLCLVDVEDGYFPIRAGDEVSFEPIAPERFEALKGERL